MSVRTPENHPWAYLLQAAVNGLTPGVISRAAHVVFTSGYCASLALALRRQAGGQIVASDDAEAWESGVRPAHAALALPDGRLLDIHGAWPLDQCEQFWGPMRAITPGQLMKLSAGAGFAKRAEPFATTLLREHDTHCWCMTCEGVQWKPEATDSVRVPLAVLWSAVGVARRDPPPQPKPWTPPPWGR